MQAICLCGLPIQIPSGSKESRCSHCGVEWHRDKSGYWSEGFRSTLFTPKFENRKVKLGRKERRNLRNAQKLREAG